MRAQITRDRWIPTDDTFGARLALIRQAMGWGNVKEAALACGVPVETWRTWERDGKTPRDLHAAATAIARATRVDPVWLAGFGDGVSAVSAYGEPSPQVPDQQLSHTSR